MNRRILNRRSLVAIIALMVALLMPASLTLVYADNPNPRVVPNPATGSQYPALSAKWWQWALKFSFADVPFFNTGGPVDISAGQSGNVWFLAGSNNGLPNGPRTGVVPAGKSLFFPLANFINDYPCPDPTFQPAPGETLEHFLQRTGNEILDYYLPPDHLDLFAEIDGVSLTNLSAYRATSSMFTFTADSTVAEHPEFDPCITGSPQSGVAVGYWLLLPPLTPGMHTLHFGAPSFFHQDVTYVLTVKP